MGAAAISRYEAYGDSHVGKPLLSFVGLQVGHARAIRWARALGETEQADKIHNKVVARYHEDGSVNRSPAHSPASWATRSRSQS